MYPRLSPDGTQVALDVRDQENDIWIWDLARETLRRLTFDSGTDSYPAWTPDGERVAFNSSRAGGARNLFWKAADGTGTVERLTDGPNAQFAGSFSPDGTRLLFSERHPETGDDLVVLLMEGDRLTAPFLATEFSERNPVISPDGRWVAYGSNASGQYEIYVRSFPDGNQGLSQISTGGGTRPQWSPDGQELFYQRDSTLMVVPVETDTSFNAGAPKVLVEGPDRLLTAGRTYDVSPDGQRLLFVKEAAAQTTEEDQIGRQLILVLNWFQELTERVPVP